MSLGGEESLFEDVVVDSWGRGGGVPARLRGKSSGHDQLPGALKPETLGAESISEYKGGKEFQRVSHA